MIMFIAKIRIPRLFASHKAISEIGGMERVDVDLKIAHVTSHSAVDTQIRGPTPISRKILVGRERSGGCVKRPEKGGEIEKGKSIQTPPKSHKVRARGSLYIVLFVLLSPPSWYCTQGEANI